MAIRPLTKSETSTLVLQLTLAGYTPGKDFKFDERGRIWARKEVFGFLSSIPVVPENDSTTETLCTH
ncbi:MAG: hypothetical protein QNJ46_23215 [Leptolyngbyaceae cyanobacterium MO_188.B28]|nr:hypothetical protein [Leptolyngbyaceae cyanobacterium MO_188.B28]